MTDLMEEERGRRVEFKHTSKDWRLDVREGEPTTIRIDLVEFRWRALKAAQSDLLSTRQR